MGRVIKFRAWHNKLKIMLNDTAEDRNSLDDYDEVCSNSWDRFCCELSLMQDDYELMQFIGLQDINGKDIYEEMEIDGLYNVEFKDGSYVLIDISNGDIVLLCNYISSRNGNVEITKEYTGI